MKLEIAFVGAGKMVSAIVNGLLHEKIFRPEQMACVSAPDGTSEKLAEASGIGQADSLEELLSNGSNRLLLGCKPQQFHDLDPRLADWTDGTIVLSIMAGITLETLGQRFSKARHLVRSMPNTPGQIRAGVTGYLFATPPHRGRPGRRRAHPLRPGKGLSRRERIPPRRHHRHERKRPRLRL